MRLILLRCAFLLVAIGLSVTFIRSDILPHEPNWSPFAVVALVTGLACAVIGVDMFLPRKRIDIISAVYFGLLVGLFLTYIAGHRADAVGGRHLPSAPSRWCWAWCCATPASVC